MKLLAIFLSIFFSFSLLAMGNQGNLEGEIICKNEAEGITVIYNGCAQQIALLEDRDSINVTVTPSLVLNETHLRGSYTKQEAQVLVNFTLKLPIQIARGTAFNARLVIKRSYVNIGGTINNDPNVLAPTETMLQCTFNQFDSEPARR